MDMNTESNEYDVGTPLCVWQSIMWVHSVVDDWSSRIVVGIWYMY